MKGGVLVAGGDGGGNQLHSQRALPGAGLVAEVCLPRARVFGQVQRKVLHHTQDGVLSIDRRPREREGGLDERMWKRFPHSTTFGKAIVSPVDMERVEIELTRHQPPSGSSIQCQSGHIGNLLGWSVEDNQTGKHAV